LKDRLLGIYRASPCSQPPPIVGGRFVSTGRWIARNDSVDAGVRETDLKRLFDIVCSLVGILTLLPLLAVLWLLVRWKMGTPALFIQERPGRDGQPFPYFKFRSMTSAVNSQGELLPDAERLTAFGRWLRKSSLDELPSLFNVLRGEMSIVGPRPLLMRYLPRYTERQGRRHEIRPGVTGWAQINGRNSIAWDEKLELDVWYVDNRSFLLDLKIIVLTIPSALLARNIEAEGHASMPEFRGTATQEPPQA